MKITRRISNWRIGVIIKPFFFRTLYVNGFTSDVFTGKGEHIIMWDFDDKVPLAKVISALFFIKERKKLGRIYIFRSGKRDSYRAICLDVVFLKEMVQTVMQTPNVDVAFVKWTLIRRSATIRYSPKYSEQIEYVGYLDPDNDNRKSLSHARILKALWHIPIPQNCVKSGRIRLVHYETIDKTVK